VIACTRRSFLSAAVAAPFAAAGDDRGRRLIVIELAGGNDGFNTVIPYRDETYYRTRPTLAIPRRDALRLTDEIGLHPSLTGLKRLWDDGQLAIVQGCGYANQSRDHFRALEAWHTAAPPGGDSLGRESYGWLGRLADHLWPRGGNEKLACIAERPPLALQSRKHDPVCGQVEPGGARIYYAGVGGFDTHAKQAAAQSARLAQVSAAIGKLVRNDAIVMIFTEFGRRLEENPSGGTDHGAAAPVFVLGASVRAGLHGAQIGTVDFRRVYAALIEWMGGDASATLQGRFEALPLFA
jgi:uncharacterized protein (DUF1501 family)